MNRLRLPWLRLLPPTTLLLPTVQRDGYWLPDRAAIGQKIEELFPELVKHEGENDDNK